MGGFFYRMGRMIGPKLRQANWVVRSLTGSEADAIEAEYAVGADLARSLTRQMEFDPDPDAEALLWSLRERLLPCLTGQKRSFVFRVVRSPEVNGFALPGGFVYVTRPLLDFCNWDPDEVAFVLAHEMGHVALFHAIDRLMANSMLSTAAGRLTRAGGVFGQHLATLASALLHQGYSREQELDADRLGVRLMAHAGFSPGAVVALLERLGELSGERSTVVQYFSSHPPPAERIRSVQKALKR
jgi:predicted Zn-dependent protease